MVYRNSTLRLERVIKACKQGKRHIITGLSKPNTQDQERGSAYFLLRKAVITQLIFDYVHKENTRQMFEITQQIGQDLDDFIEVYSLEMEKIDKRFARLEKHVGLE